MTRDDIIRMAREAGFEADESVCDVWATDGYWAEELERFAALVAAAERDKCYDIAMSEAASGSLYGWPECAHYIAKAIRARGET